MWHAIRVSVSPSMASSVRALAATTTRRQRLIPPCRLKHGKAGKSPPSGRAQPAAAAAAVSTSSPLPPPPRLMYTQDLLEEHERAEAAARDDQWMEIRTALSENSPSRAFNALEAMKAEGRGYSPQVHGLLLSEIHNKVPLEDATALLHDAVRHGHAPSTKVFNQFLTYMSKMASQPLHVDVCREVMNAMERAGENSAPDSVTYSCIITAMGRAGMTDEAFEFADVVAERAMVDDATMSAIINVCKRQEDLPKAQVVFDRWASDPERPPSTIGPFNAIMGVLMRGNEPAQALETFATMKELEWVRPNKSTYSLLIENLASDVGKVKGSQSIFDGAETGPNAGGLAEEYKAVTNSASQFSDADIESVGSPLAMRRCIELFHEMFHAGIEPTKTCCTAVANVARTVGDEASLHLAQECFSMLLAMEENADGGGGGGGGGYHDGAGYDEETDDDDDVDAVVAAVAEEGAEESGTAGDDEAAAAAAGRRADEAEAAAEEASSTSSSDDASEAAAKTETTVSR